MLGTGESFTLLGLSNDSRNIRSEDSFSASVTLFVLSAAPAPSVLQYVPFVFVIYITQGFRKFMVNSVVIAA